MQLFPVRSAAFLAALLGLAVLLPGCCTQRCQRIRGPARSVEIVPREAPRSGVYRATRAPGITDDVVEVFREGGGGPELVAVFLLQRQVSNGASHESWIIQDGASWPLTLTSDMWLQCGMGGFDVGAMCAYYGPQLGYGYGVDIPVYNLDYASPTESSSICTSTY